MLYAICEMAVRRRVLASSHPTTHRRVECVWNRCVQTWDLSSKSRWMHSVESILKICAVGCKQHGLTPLHIFFEAMIIICDHLRSSMIQYIRVCQTKLMPCRWNSCVGCCRNKASEQVSMVWRLTRWTAFKAVRRRRGIDQCTLSQVIKISHVESLFNQPLHLESKSGADGILPWSVITLPDVFEPTWFNLTPSYLHFPRHLCFLQQLPLQNCETNFCRLSW